MTTYYVRRSGSDAAAGTSAGAAWATIGKALGASGIASGDTVYIGAGIYREAVTVGFTPAATTSVIGDVDGAKTGDSGEVRWTAESDDFGGAGSAAALNLNTKKFLAFSSLVITSSGITAAITNLGGHDNSFTDCCIITGNAISTTATVNVASNFTFNRCQIYCYTANALTFTLPTSTVADYDLNILIQNCLVWSGSAIPVNISASGANSFKGGGVRVQSSTLIAGGTTGVLTANANVSTSIPCTVYDCYIISPSAGLNANTSGQILEDYNVLAANPLRTNVAVGTHSPTINLAPPLISIGQERVWGGQPRPFGGPVRDSLPYGWGTNGGGPTVDMLNRPRPSGTNRVLFTGTATSGAATQLLDTGATWGTNQLASAVCKITGGTGSGQTKIIKSNTGTTLTMYGNWSTAPIVGSTYAIYFGTPSDTGTASSGSTTTLVDSTASWVTNMWAGFILEITGGTGSGQTTTITSNTGTTLTVATLGTAPAALSTYVIYKQTSVNAVNSTAGAFERHDNAEKETGTTDAGGVGLVLTGVTDHAIYIPVDAAGTTISVKARYDATHAAGTKPQAILDANGEIGVTAETLTMSSTSGTWETLTFTQQTPSAKGWVTVRLLSRSAAATGKAFFDTVSVS